MSLISKELLSAVTNQKVTAVEGILGHPENNNLLSYHTTDENGKTINRLINMYELSYKIKEWAFNNKFVITNHPNLTESRWAYHSVRIYHFYIAGVDRVIESEFEHGRVEAESELKVIFKAGEWLLSYLNKENNNGVL